MLAPMSILITKAGMLPIKRLNHFAYIGYGVSPLENALNWITSIGSQKKISRIQTGRLKPRSSLFPTSSAKAGSTVSRYL